MLNNGWRAAREKAGLEQVRVHDLRHACGRRMRAAGVSKETRAEILGHRSELGRMTTRYSAAELRELIAAVEKICDREIESPALVVVKRASSKYQA
jgi:integrase